MNRTASGAYRDALHTLHIQNVILFHGTRITVIAITHVR